MIPGINKWRYRVTFLNIFSALSLVYFSSLELTNLVLSALLCASLLGLFWGPSSRRREWKKQQGLASASCDDTSRNGLKDSPASEFSPFLTSIPDNCHSIAWEARSGENWQGKKERTKLGNFHTPVSVRSPLFWFMSERAPRGSWSFIHPHHNAHFYVSSYIQASGYSWKINGKPTAALVVLQIPADFRSSPAAVYFSDFK